MYSLGSKTNVQPFKGYLKKGINTSKIKKEADREEKLAIKEQGPPDQKDLQLNTNIGYQAAVQKAEVIDRLGGTAPEEVGEIPLKPPTPEPSRPDPIKAKRKAYRSLCKKAGTKKGRPKKTSAKKKKPSASKKRKPKPKPKSKKPKKGRFN